MCRLDNFKIESFQSADALQKLLSELHFGLGDDSWIEDHSHIFGTIYYRDIFKCIQFLLANLPFQVHLDFEPVHLADWESRQIYSEMNTGDWWWDTPDQLPAGVRIVPVIWASDKTQLTIFRALSMPVHCMSQLVLSETISTRHQKLATGISLGWSLVPWQVPEILRSHGIPQLELGCPHSGILTLLVTASNGILMMDSRDNVILLWQPGSGIIQKKQLLLKSHMAHAQCVKFVKVGWWGIPHFDHPRTQAIRLSPCRFWTKLSSMFCTLLVFIQPETDSGNTLSAMSVDFGSLMHCICCSWV